MDLPSFTWFLSAVQFAPLDSLKGKNMHTVHAVLQSLGLSLHNLTLSYADSGMYVYLGTSLFKLIVIQTLVVLSIWDNISTFFTFAFMAFFSKMERDYFSAFYSFDRETIHLRVGSNSVGTVELNQISHWRTYCLE